MRLIKSIAVFAMLFVIPSLALCQNKAAEDDDKSAVLIDAKKPPVYLSFVKTAVCSNGNYGTVIHVGPCEKKSELDVQFEAAWVRFVNNTRWAMLVDVQKVRTGPVVEGKRLANGAIVTAAKDGAEIDVIYDIESEKGCDFSVEVQKGQPCKRRETDVPDFYRRSFSSNIVIPSGRSIVFPVNREHLIKYLTIYVLFNYEWELSAEGRPSPRYESQHRVYLSWYDLEQGIKTENGNALKPGAKKQ